MGLLKVFGSGKKAARIMAKATMDSANMAAAADRETARGNVLAQQAMIAQSRASDKAAEMLKVPQENASVILSTGEDAPSIDPATGRRKTTRSQFFAPASSGISI